MSGWGGLGLTSAVHDKAALATLWRATSPSEASPARSEPHSARLSAMLSAERAARQQGFACICGVDEAGRGPLAGPIVAGAVCLSDMDTLPDNPRGLGALNDSKQLVEARREALFGALMQGGHAVAACVVTAADIDREGIQRANHGAMARAAMALNPVPDYLLVDGYQLTGLTPPCLKMIKGDSRSLSIAAASIIAKVVRDRIMMDLHVNYPAYGFVNHKGYGTREHLDAIARHGPCPIHRLSFSPLAKTAETGMLFK